MGKHYFGTNVAAKITGCTPRQLQNWREQGFIVPTVEATGTGRSVYYTRDDLVAPLIIHFLMERGVSFIESKRVIKQLMKETPKFADPSQTGKLMLWWNPDKGETELTIYDPDKLRGAMEAGKLSATSLWLEDIHNELTLRIEESASNLPEPEPFWIATERVKRQPDFLIKQSVSQLQHQEEKLLESGREALAPVALPDKRESESQAHLAAEP